MGPVVKQGNDFLRWHQRRARRRCPDFLRGFALVGKDVQPRLVEISEAMAQTALDYQTEAGIIQMHPRLRSVEATERYRWLVLAADSFLIEAALRDYRPEPLVLEPSSAVARFLGIYNSSRAKEPRAVV